MKKFILSAVLLCGGALLQPVAPVSAQTMSVVSKSDLAGVPMPMQTVRFADNSIPKEVNDALESIAKPAAPELKRGKSEVLAWSGNGYTKAKAKEWKARVATALKNAGWEYQEGGKLTEEGATLVTVMRTIPTKRALMGFWTPTSEALVLAWTEMLPAKGGANGNTGIVPPNLNGGDEAPTNDTAPANDTDPAKETPDATDDAAPAPAPVAGRTVDITDGQYVLNAAKGLPEPSFKFPALAPVPGKARGYVYGTDGKPLKGAIIGVRSTAVGGAETSASAKTDYRGYYEVTVPFGAAGFYTSGYSKEYGDGILGMGLSPADGEADEFASGKGHVENWILKPYGIADRAGAQDQPQYVNNYYGGGIVLEYENENDGMAGPKGIPFGSTVEVTLTPKGPLLDGSKGQPLTVRKVLKDNGEMRLYLVNIPVGTYTISGRVVKGSKVTPINMEESGPDRGKSYGLDPKQADGSTQLMFRPYSADPTMGAASHGNWKEVQINIKMQ